MLKQVLRKALRHVGFDLVSFDAAYHPLARRARLLATHRIDLILDVGANVGQYGGQLREIGYKGRILSFEPLKATYDELAARAARDPLWNVMNVALGNENATKQINVSINSQASSLLEMLPNHTESLPELAIVRREAIDVRRLDSIYEECAGNATAVLLKIDAQGYERLILEGAGDCLDRIAGVQAELSLVPIYGGEAGLVDMLEFLAGRGFDLMSVEPTFADASSGRLLQIDGLFFRGERGDGASVTG